MKGRVRLARSRADSLARTSLDRAQVTGSLSNPETKKHLGQVTKPNSVSKTLKKAGLAVLLSPDPLGPIVDIPGVVLLGASHVMKKKEPANVESVLEETKLILDELQPLL